MLNKTLPEKYKIIKIIAIYIYKGFCHDSRPVNPDKNPEFVSLVSSGLDSRFF